MQKLNEDARLKVVALTIAGHAPRAVSELVGVPYPYTLTVSKQAVKANDAGTLVAFMGLTPAEADRILAEGREAKAGSDITTGFSLNAALAGEVMPVVDESMSLEKSLEAAATSIAQRVHGSVTASTPLDDCLVASEVLAKLQTAFFSKPTSLPVVVNGDRPRFESLLSD